MEQNIFQATPLVILNYQRKTAILLQPDYGLFLTESGILTDYISYLTLQKEWKPLPEYPIIKAVFKYLKNGAITGISKKAKEELTMLIKGHKKEELEFLPMKELVEVHNSLVPKEQAVSKFKDKDIAVETILDAVKKHGVKEEKKKEEVPTNVATALVEKVKEKPKKPEVEKVEKQKKEPGSLTKQRKSIVLENDARIVPIVGSHTKKGKAGDIFNKVFSNVKIGATMENLYKEFPSIPQGYIKICITDGILQGHSVCSHRG